MVPCYGTACLNSLVQMTLKRTGENKCETQTGKSAWQQDGPIGGGRIGIRGEKDRAALEKRQKNIIQRDGG